MPLSLRPQLMHTRQLLIGLEPLLSPSKPGCSMAKFNFLSHRDQPTDIKPKVRVRATAQDPFAGLRGRDYIAARGLNAPVQKVQTSAQGGDHA